jgi:UDP-N-acetylglucosamine 1-carboxyvinyltransferase
MNTVKIEGSYPISGEIIPTPNKNSILAIIPACILTKETVILTNIPKSASVRIMLRIYKDLGGEVSYPQKNTIKLNSSNIHSFILDKDLAKKERASLMFLAPLLARFGQAEVDDALGCKLGNRPVDTLISGLIEMGAKTDNSNIYKLSTKGLKGDKTIWQLEASVTGTENLVLAAVLAQGETVIYNAAAEPHVQDMCNFLNSIGANIQGIGTNKLVVKGVKELRGGQWEIIPDHIDIGGLIVAAAITGGNLRIKNAIPKHMEQILKHYEKINLNYKIEGEDIVIPSEQKLECKPNLKGNMDKIPAYPWPVGFPVDLIPQVLVLAAKASGNIRIMQNMYENQFLFVYELIKLGANVELGDTTKAITFGPSKFKGGFVVAPSIIQGAHALVLAALAAKGTTTIENTQALNRRYPELIATLQSLGARIATN